MRSVRLWTAGVLLAGSQVASAAPMTISIEALNSQLYFGQIPTYHGFYDLTVRICNEQGDCTYLHPDEDPQSRSIEARDSVLVQQTLHQQGGQVVGSTYEYQGGTLEMLLTFSTGGTPVSGGFTAPIHSLTVSAPDATGDGGDTLDDVHYVLGPGLFDPALARFLGVRPESPGGTIISYMVLWPPNGGDHQSEARQAWDGGSYIDLEVTPVPEPTTWALAALGLAAVWLRRRQLD